MHNNDAVVVELIRDVVFASDRLLGICIACGCIVFGYERCGG